MSLRSSGIQSLDSFWKMRTICAFKASTITELSWNGAKMTTTEIIHILNLFTNLKSLSCSLWKIQTEFYDEPVETLKLTGLKSLSMYKCNDATTAFFNHHLPVNSLSKLHADFYCKRLINSQCIMNELSFSEEEIVDWVAVPLTHLKMQLQKYKYNDQSVLLSILQQQPNLVSLNILSCNGIFDGDDESFVTLCNLKSLKTLMINIDDVDQVTFKENFYKLDKLEKLYIESVEDDYPSLVDNIEELSNTRLEHLKVLDIDVEHISIPFSRIEHMGTNFPHLTKLTFKCERPLPLDIYLRNFRALIDLEIDYHYSQEFSLMCINLDDLCFPSIERIKLKGFNFGSDPNLNEPAFLKLVKVVPNVMEMKIEINMPLNTRFLDNSLRRLPKLNIFEDLTLVQQKDNYEKFDLDCVKYFIGVCGKFETFSVELKLRAIDMDVRQMKAKLMEKFRFDMRRCGSQIIIKLSK